MPYQDTALPLSYLGKILVLPSRIELLSEVLQTPAMTTSAKAALNLVLLTRIELVPHPYQGCVLPFNYRSNFGTS